MKSSHITVSDFFCGAGGFSQGVSEGLTEEYGENGFEIRLAMNHWKLAIESHNSNFPTTDHHCTDIQASDPRWYRSTTVLVASPECTKHSNAEGVKRKNQGQHNLFENGKLDPSAERSRATMWDVPRFAECHGYEIIIVENVVEATKWSMWPAWIKAMQCLGYRYKVCSLNSMHFHPCPQSRDRIYVVFWKKGNPEPDLEYRPKAHCLRCEKDVESYQSWKSGRKYGKYKKQYIYRCSSCYNEVEPYYYAAFNAIDWSIKGKAIGERKKPLSEKTIARIGAGLEKFKGKMFQITPKYSSGIDCRVKGIGMPMPTQPGSASHGIVVPFIIKGENTSRLNLRPADNVFQTQCTRQTMSVVVPMLVGNYSPGWARGVQRPTGTVTTSDHHGLVQMPMIVENFGCSSAKPITERIGCMTTVEKHGIFSHESWHSFLTSYYGKGGNSHVSDAIGTQTTRDRHALVSLGDTPKIEDCYYRMLKAREVLNAMSFPKEYIVLGNAKQKVKQAGNAVTPPVPRWLIKRCVRTLEGSRKSD